MKINKGMLENKWQELLAKGKYQEIPECTTCHFALQYHARGIGYRKKDNIKVKVNGTEKGVQIKTLLNEEKEPNIESCKVKVENNDDFLNDVKGWNKVNRWEDIEEIKSLGKFEDKGKPTEEHSKYEHNYEYLKPQEEIPVVERLKDEEFELFEIVTNSVDEYSYLGSSVHKDLRFELNDHLVGFSLYDPGNGSDGSRMNNKAGMNEEKIRCGEKAKQPKEWLKIAGTKRKGKERVEPGEVGATRYSLGELIVEDYGEYEIGAQKSLYFEFFLHGKVYDGRWNNRKISLPPLDPETKEPTEGPEELAWVLWKPEDQEPYATTRGMEKEWVPSKKGHIPIPEQWQKDNPDKFDEWLKYAKDKWKSMSSQLKKETIPYRVHYRWWKGPSPIRKTRNDKYHLRLKRKNGIDSFEADKYFIGQTGIAMNKEDYVSNKWFDFTGTIPPSNEKYNPTEELDVTIEEMDKGKVELEILHDEEKSEIYNMNFDGEELEGYYHLWQDDPNSKIYILNKGTVKRDKI